MTRSNHVACRVCSNEMGHLYFDVRELMYGSKDAFRYFQCSQCKCLQIEKIPSDLSRFYEGQYYSYKTVQTASFVKRALVRLRNKYALFGSGFVGGVIHFFQPTTSFSFLKPVALTAGSRVLDVGCGSAHLLHSMCEAGMDGVLGVDPFIQEDIEYENGLKVQKCSIEKIEGTWDLVMFHHSLEHIEDERSVLDKAFRLLREGGYCIVRVPTVSSYAWEHYGVNWVQLDAPRHIYLHSRESLEILSRSCGFEVVDVVYDSTAFQFWGSEQYQNGISLLSPNSYSQNPERSMFTKEQIRVFAERAVELNAAARGDQAAFYLRKPVRPAGVV